MVAVAKRSWRESLAAYSRKETLTLLSLGFSAGLPLILTGSTLVIWLAESQIDIATVGFFAWIGFAYGFKFLWAPLVDKVALPYLTRRLGRRRSWMLLAQSLVALGLVGMSTAELPQDLLWIALCALVVGFSSATQDIALDAYRIEIAPQEMQGALAGAYQLGYRLAILVASAAALYLADFFGWTITYIAMAACMSVGIATVLMVREPARGAVDAPAPSSKRSGLKLWLYLYDALVAPFVDFYRREGLFALLILSLVGLYRIADLSIGSMASTLYVDLGHGKDVIATVTKVYGFFLTFAGVALGGLLLVRLGMVKALIIGAILGPLSNLAFVWLATQEQPDLLLRFALRTLGFAWADGYSPSTLMLSVAIAVDNMSGGFCGTVLIAFMSGLTSLRHTATQYALLSSFYRLPGTFLAGFAGVLVKSYGYEAFFMVTVLVGAPTLALVLWWAALERRSKLKVGDSPETQSS